MNKRSWRSVVLSLAFALALISGAWADDVVDGDIDAEVVAMDASARDANHGNQASRLSAQFESFALGESNADALVTGLRSGQPFTLVQVLEDGTVREAVIDPGSNGMGYGGVFMTAALAERMLDDAGLESTPANIAAVLLGGEVLNSDGLVIATFSGVITDRAAGIGWGQIAKASGLKVGELVSSLRSARGDVDKVAKADRVAKVDKEDRAKERPEPAFASGDVRAAGNARVDRVERAERPDRPERTERPDKPERVDRPDRPEKPERPAKPERPGKG